MARDVSLKDTVIFPLLIGRASELGSWNALRHSIDVNGCPSNRSHTHLGHDMTSGRLESKSIAGRIAGFDSVEIRFGKKSDSEALTHLFAAILPLQSSVITMHKAPEISEVSFSRVSSPHFAVPGCDAHR